MTITPTTSDSNTPHKSDANTITTEPNKVNVATSSSEPININSNKRVIIEDVTDEDEKGAMGGTSVSSTSTPVRRPAQTVTTSSTGPKISTGANFYEENIQNIKNRLEREREEKFANDMRYFASKYNPSYDIPGITGAIKKVMNKENRNQTQSQILSDISEEDNTKTFDEEIARNLQEEEYANFENDTQNKTPNTEKFAKYKPTPARILSQVTKYNQEKPNFQFRMENRERQQQTQSNVPTNYSEQVQQNQFSNEPRVNLQEQQYVQNMRYEQVPQNQCNADQSYSEQVQHNNQHVQFRSIDNNSPMLQRLSNQQNQRQNQSNIQQQRNHEYNINNPQYSQTNNQNQEMTNQNDSTSFQAYQNTPRKSYLRRLDKMETLSGKSFQELSHFIDTVDSLYCSFKNDAEERCNFTAKPED